VESLLAEQGIELHLSGDFVGTLRSTGIRDAFPEKKAGTLAVIKTTSVMVHKRCFENLAKKSLLILRSAGIFLYRFFCGILASRIAEGLGTMFHLH